MAPLKLQVVGLDGSSFSLRVDDGMSCRELLQLVSRRLPAKPGAVPVLCNCQGSRLRTTESLKEALVPGDADFVTVSYVYKSIVWNAWSALTEEPRTLPDDEALEGTTSLQYNKQSIATLESALPQSLRELTFGNDFDESIAGLKLPSGIEILSFGDRFNQPLDRANLSENLRSLTFGVNFNQNLEHVLLPHRLQSLTFGWDFNQSLSCALPESLRSLTFGYSFDQSIACLNCPKGLEHLSFGFCFNHPLGGDPFPSNLKTLSFGHDFNQSLEGVTFPSSLQSLTFGTLAARHRPQLGQSRWAFCLLTLTWCFLVSRGDRKSVV